MKPSEVQIDAFNKGEEVKQKIRKVVNDWWQENKLIDNKSMRNELIKRLEEIAVSTGGKK